MTLRAAAYLERLSPLWLVLAHHARETRRALWIGALAQVLAILSPYFSKLMIDRAYPSHDVTFAAVCVAATIAVTLSQVVLQCVQTLGARLLQARAQETLAIKAFSHILSLPMSFFHQQRPGELSSRFQTCRAALGHIAAGFHTIAKNEGFLLLVPPFLIYINPVLALVALCVVPLIAYLSIRQAADAYSDSKQHYEALALVDGLQTEFFGEIASVKAFQLEDLCDRRYAELTASATRLQEYRYRRHSRYNMIISVARIGTIGICTAVGWHFILSGQLQLGEFVAFIAYLGFLYNPLRDVIDASCVMQEAMISLQTVSDYLRMPSEESIWLQRPSSRRATAAAHRVGLHGVTFAYLPDVPLLVNVDATFTPGTITAIVGASGSGKTTLLHLIAGFRKPQRGSLSLGDRDFTTIPLRILRSQMTAVWQDNLLFPGSLWDNLVADRTISKRDVDHIVGLCQLQDVVAALPRGYDTLIGSTGMPLSAGERQRIAIARALIRDARILLLDEVTANIDLLNEANLLEGLRSACHERVVVFVTHRATAAIVADRVLLCGTGTLQDVSDEVHGRTAPTADRLLRKVLSRRVSDGTSTIVMS